MNNDLIIIVGYAGAYATKEIIKEKREDLLSRFSFSYIESIQKNKESFSTNKNINEYENLDMPTLRNLLYKITNKQNIIIKEAGKGGILAALWKFLEISGLGAKYSQKDIPILQSTIEISEFYKINPYRLFSKNVYIMNLCEEDAKKFLNECNKVNIPAAVIGHLTNEKQRIRIDNEEHSFLTKEQTDEIDKVLPKYTKIHK